MKRIDMARIVKAMSGQLINKEYLKSDYVHKVVRSSLEVCEGDMYVAIVGERVDGHDYIEDAFSKGALIVVVEDGSHVPAKCPAIIVEDAIKAIGDFARYYRMQFTIPFVGITGSVGKTSTKEMLASILGQKYKVLKTQGNYNNNLGMPLTILNLEEEHEVAVIEMGMDRFGEMDYLSDILKPDYGIITNIGVSHIEYLGSREGILKAKSEMLPHIKEDGHIILNGDDDMLSTLKGSYRRQIVTYGNGSEDDCRIIDHASKGSSQKMTFTTAKEVYDVEVFYLGEHILFNGLAGVLVAEFLGLDKLDIVKGMKAYVGADMRLQNFDVNGFARGIDDAYNASVESMGSALRTLLASKNNGERTVAILGSMFEMGDYSQRGHEAVGQAVSQFNPDLLLVSGDEGRWIYEAALASGYDKCRAFYYKDRDALIADLSSKIVKNDYILLKASRGMHYEGVRDYLIENMR